MTSLHSPELDSAATDSVASSPRSDHHPASDLPSRVRFMCSFGGKILPRPHDNQLRYVGGDTRIVAVHRNTSFTAFLAKLSKLSGIANVSVKYQLPNEDLDALISVTTDEDLENMMEEYDRLAHNQNPRTARLRLFLFNKGEDSSRTSSISSILDGSTNREQWFLDALNGGGPPSALGLERGRSEASSIVSEVPDYLFGLDNSDENPPREPKLKARTILAAENVSVSDPGSPAPVVSSPFCSMSSAPCVPSMPDLPPVKTKPDIPTSNLEAKDTQVPEYFVEPMETVITQPSGFPGNPMWHYSPSSHYPGPPMQSVPVYYVTAPPVPTTTVPVQQIQMRNPYPPQYPTTTGQIPVGYHPAVPGQAYGGPVRSSQPLDPMRGIPEGVNQQMFYGMTSAGMVATYPGMVMPAGEDIQVAGMEAKSGRVSQPS